MLGAIEGPGEVQELSVVRSCPGRSSYFWLLPAPKPALSQGIYIQSADCSLAWVAGYVERISSP